LSAPAPPVRHLGLTDAAAIYAGIILGSGIFVAPGAVAGLGVSIPAAVALWIAGAVVAACGASCYAECAARLPANGGFFVFNREAYGPAVAFVGGWAAIFVTYPASVAAIALVFARHLGEAVGFAGWERTSAAGALALAGVLNVAGLRTGPRAQTLLTACKLGILAVLGVAALAAGPHAAAGPAAPPPAAGTIAWLPAVMILLWTYDGWSDVTLISGEVREPGRNIGRAVLLGTAALAAVYALTQVAVMVTLPAERLAVSTRPVADAVEAIWGPAAGRAVAWAVVVSTFGAILGVVLTVSRLGFAMARDGAFIRTLATLHPRWGTPARATAALTVTAILYVTRGSFRDILTYFTFSVWIFYGLIAVALLILRRRGVGEPAPWRAPLGVVPPLVVLAVGSCMTVNLVVQKPLHALAGAAILACGYPAYVLISRSAARAR